MNYVYTVGVHWNQDFHYTYRALNTIIMVHAVLVRETYDLWLSNNKPAFLLKFKILGNTRLLCTTTFQIVDALSILFLEVGQHWPGDSAHKHMHTHHATEHVLT